MLLQILPYGEDERHPDRLIFKFDDSFQQTFSYMDHKIRKSLNAVAPKSLRKGRNGENHKERIFYKIRRGEGVIAQLPCVSAKEVVFMLPNSFRRKLTIVISPLGALLHEQGMSVKINYRFQSSAFIEPSMNREERQVLCTDIKLGKIRLVYINPYNLNMKQYREKLKMTLRHIPVQNVILDAAHCLSEWGHDFKPFYRKIPEFINWLRIENPQLTLLALTPCISPIVKHDIMEELGLFKEADHLTKPLYRDNLSFQVVKVNKPQEKADRFERAFLKDIPTALHHENLVKIFRNPEGSPSAFCVYADVDSNPSADFFLKYTQKILTDLSILDVKQFDFPQKNRFHIKNAVQWPKYIYSYFMGAGNAVRENTGAKEHQMPPGPLITTRLPDMDINTDAIRFVIHTSMADSIEHWFREISRAGRDGERSHCVQIIDMPEPACENDMLTRMTDIPMCLGNNCRFGKKELCDYGSQYNRIQTSSRSVVQDTTLALFILDQLLSEIKSQQSPLIIETTIEAIHDAELALYRLTNIGVIQEYQIDYQKETPVFEVSGFMDQVDSDYLVHSLLEYLKENDVSGANSKLMIDDFIKPFGEIHRRRDQYESALQKEISAAGGLLNFQSHPTLFQTSSDCLIVLLSYIYENASAMKYRMLWNLKEYFRTSACRYADLLNYFQIIKEDWKCRCCDLCLPDLNFLYSSKQYLPENDDDPGKLFEDWLMNHQTPFSVESARRFLYQLTAFSSGIYRRANLFLETSPRNLKALFTAREVAPEPVKGKTSIDLMAAASRNMLVSDIKQVYLTSPDSYDIRKAQFDILDDTFGPCNSPEGIQWLYSEAKKLPLDSNRIRCLGAAYFITSIKTLNTSTLASTFNQLMEEF